MKRETRQQGDVGTKRVYMLAMPSLTIDRDKSEQPLVFFRVSKGFHTSEDSPTRQ